MIIHNNEQGGPGAAAAAQSSADIDRNFMDLIKKSSELSSAAFWFDENNPLEPFSSIDEAKTRLGLDMLEVFGVEGPIQEGFASALISPNTNMVARYGNFCFGVFRGSFANLEDQLQNADIRTITVNGCDVHNGLTDNYYEADRNGFDNALRSCMTECNGCEMVLTGISQGGGTAVIAQLHWLEYDPTVITLGAPAAIHQDGCNKINSNKNYRFWSTIRYGLKIFYDTIPFSSPEFITGATHYGHAYLLFDGGHLVYLGLDDDSNRLPPSLGAHTTYQGNIGELDGLPNDRFPIQESEMVLPRGAWCGYDDECASGNCFLATGRCF